MRKKIIKKTMACIVALLWAGGVWMGYRNLHTDTKALAKSETKDTIVFGYQKGDVLHLSKIEGGLEKELNEQGYKVKWKEFTDGSALLEALVTGNIDYGRTGNTPPVVSQSSGSDVVYVASSYSKYEGSAILVPAESSIASLSDLKGKTIALSKGSSSHYFLIKALESVGLMPDDVKLKFLDPSAGRIALDNGKVDAWVVWDPYTAAAQVESNAKVITTAEGFSTDRDFVLSTRKFVKNHEALTNTITEQMTVALKWVNENKSTVAAKLAKALKLDDSIAEMMMKRRTYGMDGITEDILTEQQDIADTFYQTGFIKKEIDVKDATLDTND